MTDTCTCTPCEDPQWGAPGIAHCAACCGGSGIVEYDHDCPIDTHRQWAERQFPTEASTKEPTMTDLPPGTPVLAYPGVRPDEFPGSDPTILDTVTRGDVWEIAGIPVVNVVGYAGGIALSHIDRKETP